MFHFKKNKNIIAKRDFYIAKKLILEAKHTVALTGAGVSTDSGIPDFRSPTSGLWHNFDPAIFTAHFFHEHPDEFYDVGKKFLPTLMNAQPNRIHHYLSKLENSGYLQGIVTQNIDGLHQKAGSNRVFELHGNLQRAKCLDCLDIIDASIVLEKINSNENPPLCDKCGGVLKVDVILFGDPMSLDFQAAIEFVDSTDLFIVLGTSLRVHPANLIPERALMGKAKMIIVNRESTPYDHIADVVIHEELMEFISDFEDIFPLK